VPGESVFRERPQEFSQENFLKEGTCDAQSILPAGDHYVCHCTCGRWDVTVATAEQGLELARQHTREVTERHTENLHDSI
jgi:hypothetical protein